MFEGYIYIWLCKKINFNSVFIQVKIILDAEVIVYSKKHKPICNEIPSIMLI